MATCQQGLSGTDPRRQPTGRADEVGAEPPVECDGGGGAAEALPAPAPTGLPATEEEEEAEEAQQVEEEEEDDDEEQPSEKEEEEEELEEQQQQQQQQQRTRMGRATGRSRRRWRRTTAEIIDPCSCEVDRAMRLRRCHR